MFWVIAYLGFVGCIIIGGILGLFISVLVLSGLGVTVSDVHVLIGIALGAFTGGILAVIRVRRHLKVQREKELAKHLVTLPENAVELIKAIVGEMRYRKGVQDDVATELAAHFEDALRDCETDAERKETAEQLIKDFGEPKLLGVLLRRAKKRCRPLWRTVVARTFQTVGVLVLCFILYVVWFLTGKPNITVDYVAQFNRVARPATDEALNAAPLYLKAVKFFEKLPDDIAELIRKKPNEVSPEQKQLMAGWLQYNKEILDLVIAGTKKPYYWPKYATGNNTSEAIAILMPHLSDFRNLAYTLRWRAQLLAEKGQYEEALADMKTCYRFGRHLKGDKTLIEQLVGTAIEAVAVQTIRKILSQYKVDPSSLAALQHSFEQIVAAEDFTVSLRAEKVPMYDEIQRCFTEDRFGGGHLYFGRLQRIGGLVGHDVMKKGFSSVLHIFFTHPNKRETREMVERYYDYWEKMAPKTPAELRAEFADFDKQAMELIKGNLLLEAMAPAIGRIIELSHRSKTDTTATLAIMALLRYNADKGFYPENLQQLITAGYLKEVPMDAFSDGPLVYKKTDDNFSLYSVGPNFKDDGGQIERDREGRVKLWAGEGDAVFWPVPKPETPQEREKRLQKQRGKTGPLMMAPDNVAGK